MSENKQRAAAIRKMQIYITTLRTSTATIPRITAASGFSPYVWQAQLAPSKK